MLGLAAAAAAVANSARTAAPYTFMMAKIRAWEARMMSDAKIDSLAETGSLEALLSGFRGTDYESEMEGAKEDLEEIEARAIARLLAAYHDVIELLPPKAVGFVRKFAERLDIGNLKLAVQAISGQADRELAISSLSDGIVFARDRLEVLARTETLQGFIEQMTETEYFQELEPLAKTGEFGAIEVVQAIERSYYASLWRKAAELGRKNMKIAREIVGREVDLVNLKTLIRLKAADSGADVIMRNVIQVHGELNLPTLRACAQADSIEEIRNILARSALKSAIVPLLAGAGDDVGEIERLLDESLLNFAKGTSLFKPLTIATPLAYLYEKHGEVRNVRALARAIGDGLTSEELKPLILRSARVE
jgi:ATP synthase A1 C subunit